MSRDGDTHPPNLDFLDVEDPREALHGALEWWVQKHDKSIEIPGDSLPVILTRSVLILEVQEPLRKHKTLCYRTTDMNFQGMHSWEVLGFATSLLEQTKEFHRETTVDPEDAPPNDFEADDGSE